MVLPLMPPPPPDEDEALSVQITPQPIESSAPSPAAVARTQSAGNGKPPFDIVSTYQSLLRSDPDLTMPVAAIESLVQLLSASPSLSTISETLDLLAVNVEILKRSVPNAISLSAGTDLFQRYLITTLRPGGPGLGTGSGVGGDFKAIRQHLLSNGRLFVTRAKAARGTIAEIARRFVREGSTVLTNGGSRVVGAVLRAAALVQAKEGGAPRFRVIYVTSSSSHPPADTAYEGASTIASLRALSVPVATIPESAVAYCMSEVSIALVGAEGVVENGGIISRLGTYQLAVLAKAASKPVHVVAESHKFVRMFPLGQYDLGVEQKVLEFTTDPETPRPASHAAPARTDSLDSLSAKWAEQTPMVTDHQEYFDKVYSPQSERSDGSKTPTSDVGAVDYTPPDLITALITEAGVLTPSAVSEELIKIWY